MKTTVELPDGLWRRAKELGARRSVTLRSLVIEGLEKTVDAHKGVGGTAADKQPLPKDAKK